jgi:hypothetical protein
MTSRRSFLTGLAGLAAAAIVPPTSAAAAIPSGVLGQQMNLPISKLASKTYFQGAAWAKSPVSGREYVFQLQAKPVGPGDVEDLTIHRYELKSGALYYVDSMVGKGWGHCQTLKVRISASDNPYVLLGWEDYDPTTHVQTGTTVMRCRYRGGTTQTRAYADAQRVWLDTDYALPIDCADWTVAVRRVVGNTEIVEWYDETELLAATQGNYATPKHTVTFPKAGPVLQGMCATGTYDQPDDVWRVNGGSGQPATLYRFPASGAPGSTMDVSDIVNGNSDGEEVESVLRIGSELWVGKQTSVSSRRILALRKVGTIG